MVPRRWPVDARAAAEISAKPSRHRQPPPARPPTDRPPTLNLAALQGKWLGFRSAAAGDRFLQARKCSRNRLVFFSQNVGTWEQWELCSGGPDPDAAEWASLALTLRHRRLPQLELAVEVERVGSVAPLPGSGAATPRSLAAGDAASAGSTHSGSGAADDPTLERRELKRMSGVLVHVSAAYLPALVLGRAAEKPAASGCLGSSALAHPNQPCAHTLPLQEWLHYVDKEKEARLVIEARVAQMAEDAAGLREWAVMQVGGCAASSGQRETLSAGGSSTCVGPARWEPTTQA